MARKHWHVKHLAISSTSYVKNVEKYIQKNLLRHWEQRL